MKILVAIPSGENIPVETVRCLLALKPVGQVDVQIHDGSLVYYARECLAANAVTQGFDWVFWLDSDMTFTPTILEDLLKNDRDICAGLFFRRKPPCTPAYWSRLRMGIGDDKEEVPLLDYPRDTPFEVDAMGMAAVLMRTKVLAEMLERYGATFHPLKGYGEDISFCIRAKNMGYSLYVDPRVKVGHKAQTIVTEETYLALKDKGLTV